MKYLISLVSLSLIFFTGCGEEICCADIPEGLEEQNLFLDSTAIVVLGTCQDAGSPQINCQKECCRHLHLYPDPNRKVVSLGLVIPETEKTYLFEASPDFPSQTAVLAEYCGFEHQHIPDGIFLTHAHIGHYAGLMHLGKEAMNANDVPVYVMPKMKAYLETNGPWEQLVKIDNIELVPIENEKTTQLNENLLVIPFLVPHRDEYSETVGFRIEGPNKSAIFIPDIDKWDKWNKDIITVISSVDYAFIDATFFDENELKNRDMDEIPHPLVVESMTLFEDLPVEEKSKIIFIHLNHTNPLLDSESEQFKQVIENGFSVAQKGDVYYL